VFKRISRGVLDAPHEAGHDSGARHEIAFSPRIAPELCKNLVPRKQEGAGKAGCPLAPMVRVQQEARGRTTGTGGSSGLPCAMVLTVSFALSSVTMLGCHRRP